MVKFKQNMQLMCLILFVLTVAIALTINAKWLYVIDITRLEILDYVTISKEELLKNYSELMTYLNFFWINPLKMTDFPVSESGALHFFEVKRLFQINYAVLLITSIPSIKLLTDKIRQRKAWELIKPFSYLLMGLMFILVFMATAFDQFFVIFHEVFFNNDAWIFDPVTDPIITVLPQDYFMHCFILFFVLFVFFILLIILIGKIQLKKIKTTD